MDQLSIPAIFVILVVTVLLVVELGYPLGRWFRREQGLDKYPLESSASSTVLGLLAFILAFAFGVSASRYSEMRDVAREDTDSIEDVYLMSDFLDEEDGRRVRGLVREYHTVRFEAIESRDRKQLGAAIARAEELQDELWAITVPIRNKSDNSVLNQFVSAVHAMMDAHSVRVTKALVTRLPPVIWVTLGVLLLLASLMLGFTSGLHGSRSRLASSIIIISFSAVIVMIVDLDRPFRSLFRHSGDPTAAALLEKMNSDPRR